jgi:hypothetical protein
MVDGHMSGRTNVGRTKLTAPKICIPIGRRELSASPRLFFLSQKDKQIENQKLHYLQDGVAADRKKRSATIMPPQTESEQIFKL